MELRSKREETGMSGSGSLASRVREQRDGTDLSDARSFQVWLTEAQTASVGSGKKR